jgi:hypothetical protein
MNKERLSGKDVPEGQPIGGVERQPGEELITPEAARPTWATGKEERLRQIDELLGAVRSMGDKIPEPSSKDPTISGRHLSEMAMRQICGALADLLESEAYLASGESERGHEMRNSATTALSRAGNYLKHNSLYDPRSRRSRGNIIRS